MIAHIHVGAEDVSLNRTAWEDGRAYEEGRIDEAGPGNMIEGQRIVHLIEVVGIERSLSTVARCSGRNSMILHNGDQLSLGRGISNRRTGHV